MSKEKRNLPSIADLTKDTKIAEKNDKFNFLLNQPPPESWIQEHPIITGYRYVPVDKVEYLLKRIFKRHKIEVLREGEMFNSVYCTVRIHYIHPVENKWDFQDGEGAVEVQTEKGATPSDLSKIKHGAVAKALPTAKSRAKKNAASELGKMFGSDLNREDTLVYRPDKNLEEKETVEGDQYEMVKEAVELGKENGGMSAARANNVYDLTDDQKSELYDIEEGNDE